MSELADFERLLPSLKAYLRTDIRRDNKMLPPPFVQEFLGTPSSGKSTIIEHLDTFWRRAGFRSYCPQEGAQAVRYLERGTPVYGIATGLYAFQLLLQVSENHQYDQVIFDRCIFDTYTWMKYFFKKG